MQSNLPNHTYFTSAVAGPSATSGRGRRVLRAAGLAAVIGGVAISGHSAFAWGGGSHGSTGYSHGHGGGGDHEGHRHGGSGCSGHGDACRENEDMPSCAVRCDEVTPVVETPCPPTPEIEHTPAVVYVPKPVPVYVPAPVVYVPPTATPKPVAPVVVVVAVTPYPTATPVRPIPPPATPTAAVQEKPAPRDKGAPVLGDVKGATAPAIPRTGAATPLTEGFALMAVGIGLLVAGMRRPRGRRTDWEAWTR